MERTYPRRYGGESVDRHVRLVAGRLGQSAAEVSVEGEMDPDRAELVSVDDFSVFSRGTTVTSGTRADVVYIDEAFGTVFLDGPIYGERYGRFPEAAGLGAPLPLPVVLWKAGTEAGVWVLVSSRRGFSPGEPGCARSLLRVTEAVLERGRLLYEGLEWSRQPLG
ncbi:MAG: hypothetical protein H0V53_03480 [Rubrobacter sp.]|nr:hypothetical protein [Rubrobacter sp.]